jgi:hypothetical protein
MKYQKISDYVKEEVRKNKHKKLLEIFLILDSISEKENIISFNYSKPYLIVQVGRNDYYRVKIKEVN